jgi:hypothetical protein
MLLIITPTTAAAAAVAVNLSHAVICACHDHISSRHLSIGITSAPLMTAVGLPPPLLLDCSQLLLWYMN